jgi:hypothetical protein
MAGSTRRDEVPLLAVPGIAGAAPSAAEAVRLPDPPADCRPIRWVAPHINHVTHSPDSESVLDLESERYR